MKVAIEAERLVTETSIKTAISNSKKEIVADIFAHKRKGNKSE